MRDCRSTAFSWVPGAFSNFFLAEVKDLGIDHDVMTLEIALDSTLGIHSLHLDDAQVILAHYRGSRKDWDQQW